jgi:hypothetical protein
MSKVGSRGKKSQVIRRENVIRLAAERATRSPAEQLKRLDAKLGVGVGAKKERARLKMQMEQRKKSQSTSS